MAVARERRPDATAGRSCARSAEAARALQRLACRRAAPRASKAGRPADGSRAGRSALRRRHPASKAAGALGGDGALSRRPPGRRPAGRPGRDSHVPPDVGLERAVLVQLILLPRAQVRHTVTAGAVAKRQGRRVVPAAGGMAQVGERGPEGALGVLGRGGCLEQVHAPLRGGEPGDRVGGLSRRARLHQGYTIER